MIGLDEMSGTLAETEVETPNDVAQLVERVSRLYGENSASVLWILRVGLPELDEQRRQRAVREVLDTFPERLRDITPTQLRRLILHPETDADKVLVALQRLRSLLALLSPLQIAQ